MKHPNFVTTPEISKRMAKIRLKDGRSESVLAKELWHRGIRYRKNFKKLPRSPDIALTKYKIAIFIDGEFWHGYDWDARKQKLKSNKDYWIEKIEENMARDVRNNKLLIDLGWKSIHFWEKEIKKDLAGCIEKILVSIQNER